MHLEILGFPMGGAYYYRDIFAHFKTMRRKQNLASDFGFQKENWGEIMHFSEIIKLQFGKKRPTLLCILLLFRIIVAWLSLKNAWLPPISLNLAFNTRYQNLLFPHSDKLCKNTLPLVGTVLKLL